MENANTGGHSLDEDMRRTVGLLEQHASFYRENGYESIFQPVRSSHKAFTYLKSSLSRDGIPLRKLLSLLSPVSHFLF